VEAEEVEAEGQALDSHGPDLYDDKFLLSGARNPPPALSEPGGHDATADSENVDTNLDIMDNVPLEFWHPVDPTTRSPRDERPAAGADDDQGQQPKLDEEAEGVEAEVRQLLSGSYTKEKPDGDLVDRPEPEPSPTAPTEEEDILYPPKINNSTPDPPPESADALTRNANERNRKAREAKKLGKKIDTHLANLERESKLEIAARDETIQHVVDAQPVAEAKGGERVAKIVESRLVRVLSKDGRAVSASGWSGGTLEEGSGARGAGLAGSTKEAGERALTKKQQKRATQLVKDVVKSSDARASGADCSWAEDVL
jgi:hypothetical protein